MYDNYNIHPDVFWAIIFRETKEVEQPHDLPPCIICGDTNPSTLDPALCVSCERAANPGRAESLANAAARRLGLALIAGLFALTLSPASAHDYPTIGTPAYSAGCTITHEWEDGSALAYCPEDGGKFVFDPDGDPTTGKLPGWYVIP